MSIFFTQKCYSADKAESEVVKDEKNLLFSRRDYLLLRQEFMRNGLIGKCEEEKDD